MLHSLHGLQLCCSHSHNTWRCLRLSSADSHIVSLCYCYISDGPLAPYMSRFVILSYIAIQSSLRIHRLPLHLLCHYYMFCAIFCLPNWIDCDLTLSTYVQTWYWLEHEISNVSHCFSIPLSRSPLYMPQMLWTKWCFAALRCSSTSLLSSSVRFQMMLSQRVTLHNLLSPSRLHSLTAICSTCRGQAACPLQLQDASCRSDQIDGCCDCRRPLIKV